MGLGADRGFSSHVKICRELRALEVYTSEQASGARVLSEEIG